VVATHEQVATLSMQRRVFWMRGQAYLVVRSDGFLETVATLQALLRQPLPEGAAEAVTPPAAEEPQGEPEGDPQRELQSAAPAEPLPPEPASTGDAAPPPAPMPARPSAMTGPPASGTLAMTARLVASYVATNRVAISDLDALIRSVHRTVAGLHQPRRG